METAALINREEVEVRETILVEISEAIQTTIAIMDLQEGIIITNIKGIIPEMTWEATWEMTKGVIRRTAMKISEVITVEVSEFTTELTEEEEGWAIKANHTDKISGKVEMATSETYMFDINKSLSQLNVSKLNFYVPNLINTTYK